MLRCGQGMSKENETGKKTDMLLWFISELHKKESEFLIFIRISVKLWDAR